MTTGLEPSAAALETLPFSVLLDRALVETRRHLRRLWPPFAIALAALGLILVAVSRLWPIANMPAFQPPQPGEPPLQTLMPLLAFEGLACLTGLTYYLLHQAMAAATVRAAEGVELSGAGALLWVLGPARLKTIALVVLCFVGSCCCCFPVIFYIGPLLSFALLAQASEGVSGAAALRRSALLARYNPERRFGSSPIVRVLAIAVLGYVGNLLLQMLIIVPSLLIRGADLMRRLSAGELLNNLRLSADGPLWLQVPLQCLSAAVSATLALYCSFAVALVFLDVRRRREGADLQAAVAGMAVGALPAPGEPGAPGGEPRGPGSWPV
jgi:hypothetical protein